MNEIKSLNIWKKENLLIVIAIICFLLYYYRRELKKSSLFQNLTKQLPILIELIALLEVLAKLAYDDGDKSIE